MFGKLVLLFIAVPLVELFLLIRIGTVIGPVPTIALVIVTGILGASLARSQGFKTLQKIQNELAAGRIPTGELLDGLMILAGGIVLLTPGILTDLFGFSLMLPPVRAGLKQWLEKKFQGMIVQQQGSSARAPAPDDNVIDV